MRILIAEDDATSARILERILSKQGYQTWLASDGREALALARQHSFDAVLTDWMMPHVDGMELIRQIRSAPRPAPFIMVVTSLDGAQAREHALRAGADDYLAKPYGSAELLTRLQDGIARYLQPAPRSRPIVPRSVGAPPPFLAVCIATSTGGPETLSTLLRHLPATPMAAFLLVVHGPAWMLETLAERLRPLLAMPIKLAVHGEKLAPGTIYLAPGDRHLLVRPGSLTLDLSDAPQENYVRPAADPLFRSAAQVFGRHCIAVVLTGLGRDGTLGAAQVAGAGGVVIAQDPATAVASSMPQTVIDSGSVTTVAPLERMATTLSDHIRRLTAVTAK